MTMILLVCLVTSMALLPTVASQMVSLKIVMPEAIEKQFANADKELPQNEAVQIADTLKNVGVTLGKVNLNLDEAQDTLAATFKMVAAVISTGEIYQSNYNVLQDQFKRQPTNLIQLKELVAKLKQILPHLKALIDAIIDSGMDSDSMKKTQNNLNDLITSVLDDLLAELKQLPDETKAIATGENMPDAQKPDDWQLAQSG